MTGIALFIHPLSLSLSCSYVYGTTCHSAAALEDSRFRVRSIPLLLRRSAQSAENLHYVALFQASVGSIRHFFIVASSGVYVTLIFTS